MKPGTFVISYGDAPSLRMVRVVRVVRDDGSFTAPYIRADKHLRRYDNLQDDVSGGQVYAAC